MSNIARFSMEQTTWNTNIDARENHIRPVGFWAYDYICALNTELKGLDINNICENLGKLRKSLK